MGGIDDAAMRRRAGSILVALALIACSGPATDIARSPSLSPSRQASASPEPTPLKTANPPTASPIPRPTEASSEQVSAFDIGSFPSGGLSGMLGFAAGYVAWGTYGLADHGNAFTIWHSPDGETWTRTLQAEQVAPCPGWTPRSNLADFYAGGTDGQQVILIGSVLDSPTREACDEAQPIALSSLDGIIWQRSEPSGLGDADEVWPTDDGWVSFSGSTGELSRSADGLSWQPAGSLEPSPDARLRLAASADGTLVAGRGREVLASTDGEEWDLVHTLLPGFSVMQIRPPARDGSPWIIATNDFEAGHGQLLSSVDLRTWQASDTPNPETAWILPWNGGYLALTHWMGRVIGCDPCPAPPAPVLSWSADGERWSEVHLPDYAFQPMVVDTPPADGPAGLLYPAGYSSDGALILRMDIR